LKQNKKPMDNIKPIIQNQINEIIKNEILKIISNNIKDIIDNELNSYKPKINNFYKKTMILLNYTQNKNGQILFLMILILNFKKNTLKFI